MDNNASFWIHILTPAPTCAKDQNQQKKKQKKLRDIPDIYSCLLFHLFIL